ncbi:MAG TPA: RES family NAD+ phosphorylase [Pedobacter sp.]|nr:RES family NAD+ phosphorylase [Pedobacter sp.]
MKIFKICRTVHANLSASGIENRWNRKGQYVIYAAESRSLATLEMVSHRSGIMPKTSYQIIVIDIAEEEIKHVLISDLPGKWNKLAAYPALQKIGSDWYEDRETLILRVPSAIIPQEYNYIINTEHPLFSLKVKVLYQEDFHWDERIL